LKLNCNVYGCLNNVAYLVFDVLLYIGTVIGEENGKDRLSRPTARKVVLVVGIGPAHPRLLSNIYREMW